MATTHGKSDAALVAELAEQPWRFSFFMAVQLLQRLSPQAVAVGELGPAQREAIRFVHDSDLSFHAADITRITPRVLRDGSPFAEVTSSFLGLYGTVSPLASFISEEVMFAEEADESSLKAFYDILHHRVLSLFYRSWRKYRFSAGFRVDGKDAFTRRALSFVGVDAAAMPREGLSAVQLLAMARLLAIRTRPARSLQVMLEHLFPNTPIELTSFIARRVPLKDDQLARLGSQNSSLGLDLSVGRSVVDRTGRFRVGIGPVSYEMFEGLMPGGRHYPTLRKVIDQFSRGVLEIECELTLDHKETPRLQLGVQRGAQLGVTTTLRPAGGKPMRARFVMSDELGKGRPVILDEDRPVDSVAP